jgi:hypothetical protein
MKASLGRALVLFWAASAAAVAWSCSSSDHAAGVNPGSLPDGAALPCGDPLIPVALDPNALADAALVADAGCAVAIDSPPLLPGLHVPVCSTIQWDSNPPSSGSHYPIWARYQTYASPVPRGFYVHNAEHGSIVFLYHCADMDGGCPDVVAALEAASDSLPDDPLCAALGEGVRVRTLVSPDPLIDVPVAAVAWGWTYRAQCVDLPSLRAFAAQHYAAPGTETLCANGISPP